MNVRIGSLELPIGLALITLVLFSVAVINLFTKQVATISGVSFTLILYAAFVATERSTARRTRDTSALDQFQLMPADDIQEGAVDIEPGNVLVPVRDYNTLTHLAAVVHEVHRRDIVVMTARVMKGPDAGSEGFDHQALFTDYEQLLFTRVVAVAEREGRPVRLLIVPAADAISAIVQTAFRLHSSEIALGESAKVTNHGQARLFGEAWDRIDGARARQVRLVIYRSDGKRDAFSLAVHAPELTPAEL